MKYAIFLALALFAPQSHAAEISPELEAAILNEMTLLNCDLSQYQGLAIESVKTTTKEVDQGSVDTYYFIQAEVLEGRLRGVGVTVEAVEYAISNPGVNRIEILSLESDLCR